MRLAQFEAMKRAMEAALVAEPDDAATHRAYADLLQEHGGAADAVRGEFIGVQLALEEPRPARERTRLRKRERQLLDVHQREWLGELAPFLLDGEVPGYEAAHWGHTTFPVFRTDRPAYLPEGQPFEPPTRGTGATFSFRRGWLDQLHLPRLSLYSARVLRQTPLVGLVRRLTIEEVDDYGNPAPDPSDNVPDGTHSIGLCPLVGSDALANVIHFRLGPEPGDNYRAYNCHIHGRAAGEVVRQMPRLEELHLFANDYDLNALFRSPSLSRLRVLQVYHRGQVHRLQLLAENPAAGGLTHLLLHPHNANAWHWNSGIDDPDNYRPEDGYLPLSVVRPFLRSPNFPHLQHLRLRCSSMGDEGCREIVACGILKRLKTLDLRHGCITDAGARILAESGDLPRLGALDLDHNSLTADGIASVRATGVGVRADDQTHQSWGNYLTEGEFE